MALDIRRAQVADAAGIAAVHCAGWEENYRGLIPDEIIDARTIERRTEMWRDSLPRADHLTFVGAIDGEICGFASAVLLDPPVAGFASYLQTLYLRSAVKRRGIGRALLQRLSVELLERGCTNMALRTLRLNPARRFYERFGARLLDDFPYETGQFDDVAYGFDDVRTIVAGHGSTGSP